MKNVILGESEYCKSTNERGTVIIDLDLIAMFHRIVRFPDTYAKIYRMLICMLKKIINDVERVDLVADNYTVNISPIKRESM